MMSEIITFIPEGQPWASATLRQLRDDIACAVKFDTNVMITGGSGVGKTFVASLIHQQSRRGFAPLTILECADIGESPNDSFKEALLKTANNGTLLIKEIQKLPEPTQLELLRFIESELPKRDRVRLMITCSTDLFERVQSNDFLDELFYHLNVVHLVIPALRDRPEDIEILFRHYLSSHTRVEPALTTAAWERLVAYPWPGNVRELKTVAEKLAERDLPRPVDLEDLPPEISQWGANPRSIH